MHRPDHVIVLSIDSLSSSDMELISMLPNFKEYINNASICDNVTSVYPSLTYPAHATISTGLYPIHHGIINNTMFQPNRTNPDWYWKDSYINGKTIYGEAIEKGLKVASLLWPVTAKSKIQYNLPEIFPNRRWENQIAVSLLNGSKSYQIILEKNFGHLRDGINQPELDQFIQASLLYTLEKIKPELTLVHYTDIDTCRHKYGYSAPPVFRAMERMDDYLGEIIKLLKKEGMYENTALIILGDHSQIDVHTGITLNDRFEKDGYIIKKNKKLIDWEIFADPCGGSCYIYLKEPENNRLYDEIFEYLHILKGESYSGISNIYSAEEASNFGADKNCSFMLEAGIGYYFVSDKMGLKAAHGYLPTIQGYQTVFMASGKGIKKNVQVISLSLVDIAPTIARLLDVDLGPVDGTIIEDLLEL